MSDSTELRYDFRMLDASIRSRALAAAAVLAVLDRAGRHLDGVASEKIVRSSHSTQGEPDTIEEVRRILREHVPGH